MASRVRQETEAGRGPEFQFGTTSVLGTGRKALSHRLSGHWAPVHLRRTQEDKPWPAARKTKGA